MSAKEMERNLFANGCEIEFEFITSDNRKIRQIRARDGKVYNLVYVRNEHYVFTADSVMEV